MTPERHARIKEIFLAVCDLTGPAQSSALAEQCGADDDLRREVEKLLRHQSVAPAGAEQTTTSQMGSAIPIGRAADSLGLNHLLHAPASAAVAGFAPGTLLDRRYRIVCLLGAGGMGEVYRAEDLSLGQTVALKFLPRRFAQHPAPIQRMREEVRVARQVTHPHICRVHDLGQIGEDYFISMEYIEGEDLHHLLRRIGRLPYEKALQIAREICSGLAAAHAKGILHRDLKPSNIMIDGRGHARISDFGLAAVWDQIPRSEIRLGTPGYMAPEQASGREVSVQSDLFALGLILYQLFTGDLPFPRVGAREPESLMALPAPVPPSTLVDGLDPRVDAAILQCLELDPHRRPVSAMAVSAALPGRGPLETALAAGETVPPEVLAAAEPAQPFAGVLDRFAAPAFVAILFLLIFLSWTAHPLQRCGETCAPAVLAEHARRFASDLNVPLPLDEAFGFQSLLDPGITGRKGQDPVPGASDPAQNPAVFWYRSAQAPLAPLGAVRRVFGDARVTLTDPPGSGAGGCRILLDTRGRLLTFETEVLDPPPAIVAEASKKLLRQGGLESALLTPTAPRLIINTTFDAQRAWTTSDSATGRLLRVEEASFKGAIVFWSVTCEELGWTSAPTFGSVTWRRNVLWWSEFVLVGALGIVSMPLARTNLRRRRSDRQGALRMASFVFVVRIIGWGLQASHVSDLRQEAIAVLLMAAGAVSEAALMWLLYLALEPYARRLWPQALVSWARVLHGRLIDIRVGRDVLAGCVLGAWLALAFRLDLALVSWTGLTLRAPVRSVDFFRPFESTFTSLAFFCDTLRQAVYMSLAFMLLAVLFRTIIRNALVAGFVAVLLISPLFVPYGAHQFLSLLIVGSSCVGVLVWSLGCMGLLPVVVASFVAIILIRFPLTLNPRLWYAEPSLLASLVVCSLVVGSLILIRRERLLPSAF